MVNLIRSLSTNTRAVQVVELITYVVVGRALETWFAQWLLRFANSGFTGGTCCHENGHENPCAVATLVYNTLLYISFGNCTHYCVTFSASSYLHLAWTLLYLGLLRFYILQASFRFSRDASSMCVYLEKVLA